MSAHPFLARRCSGFFLRDSIKLWSVALPGLATGVGGLDWMVVRPLIQSLLGDVAATLYVYSRFVPGKKAAEPKA